MRKIVRCNYKLMRKSLEGYIICVVIKVIRLSIKLNSFNLLSFLLTVNISTSSFYRSLCRCSYLSGDRSHLVNPATINCMGLSTWKFWCVQSLYSASGIFTSLRGPERSARHLRWLIGYVICWFNWVTNHFIYYRSWIWPPPQAKCLNFFYIIFNLSFFCTCNSSF